MSCIVCTDLKVFINLHCLLQIHWYYCIEEPYRKHPQKNKNNMYRFQCSRSLLQNHMKMLCTFLHALGNVIRRKLLFLAPSLHHHFSIVLQHYRRQCLSRILQHNHEKSLQQHPPKYEFTKTFHRAPYRHVNWTLITADFGEVRKSPNVI